MTLEPMQLGARLGQALAANAPAAQRALVRATVELLHRERTQGHVCIALDEHAGTRLADRSEPFPSPLDWRDGLLESGIASIATETAALAPLIIDDARRLYLRRDHDAERRILAALDQRLAAEPTVAAQRIGQALRQLGQHPAAGGNQPGEPPDWQLAAATAGVTSPFLLLTGGPGTGKTTTIARLLSLTLTLAADARIALCAPTGKAAARMSEAIASHAANDPTIQAGLARLAPQTLHRLLGYRPLDDAFRYGREQQLPYDLVVVDEASMLDPALLAILLEALPPAARLVLVGDRDQLAAVAAGQVLGDLCRAARPDRGVGTKLAQLVAAATGIELRIQSEAPPIADAVIALRVNHRFGAQPGLDEFARALAQRDPAAALAVLDAGHPDLTLAADPDLTLAEFESALLAAVKNEPDEALAQLGRMRILAASRYGEGGVLAWNRRVETLLRRHDVRVDEPWYRGRPILVTSNDHQNRIYNGDLGVVWRDADGRPQVAFAGPGGTVRLVSPFRVPAHETAWAMTVHKAQGSEFDAVVLAMPDSDSPLWQAPLIYTGITRARRRAVLVADRQLLTQGLSRWPERGSGLCDGLAL